MKERAAEGLVLLDACCLINLFATGRAGEILARLPLRFAVARYVVETEVLEIGEEGQAVTELIDEGTLEQLEPTGEREFRELVRFAAQLDDGEAHTCALAVVRGARVATDDRKAIRVLKEVWEKRGEAGEPVLRTSELVFPWAQAQNLADAELAGIVRSIARRASFLPPRADPFYDRWMALLQTEP